MFTLPPKTLQERVRECVHNVNMAIWLIEHPMPWDTEADRQENERLFNQAARELGEAMMAVEDAQNEGAS